MLCPLKDSLHEPDYSASQMKIVRVTQLVCLTCSTSMRLAGFTMCGRPEPYVVHQGLRCILYFLCIGAVVPASVCSLGTKGTGGTEACCVGGQARDPIPQFREYCLKNGLLTEANIKEIEASVLAEVEESVTFADESPKPVRPPECVPATKHLHTNSSHPYRRRPPMKPRSSVKLAPRALSCILYPFFGASRVGHLSWILK
jgi:hypothetical protein